MNNGDKVRQMTNKELIEWGIRFFRTDWDDASVVMSDKEIKESCLEILNAPHETTADEDFAEIGYIAQEHAGPEQIYWFGREKARQLIISADNMFLLGEKIIDEKRIDQIRKIADKKRKEVWG